MSRFNNLINGLQENAHFIDKRRAEEMDKQFETDATVIDGIVRWNSNDRIPPKEILEFWNYIGKEFDYEKSVQVSDQETSSFLNEYRKQQENRVYSEEEKSEMRAAFGSNASIVNAITGKKIQL